MSPEAFHRLMTHPSTSAQLDAMIADNARADAEQAAARKPQRKDCCADFAYVICCDEQWDTWECPFCGETWTVPCR